MICSVCKEEKQDELFYHSCVKIHETRLPICKSCCRERYKLYNSRYNYLEQQDKKGVSLWLILAELGVPFIYDYYLGTIEVEQTVGRNIDYVNTYLGFIGTRFYDDFGESDTMITKFFPKDEPEEIEEEETIEIVQEENSPEEAEESTPDVEIEIEPEPEPEPELTPEEQVKLNAQIRKWGKNYTMADLDWLDVLFEDYTKEIEFLDTPTELTYRALCREELKRYNGEATKEVHDNIAKFMKILKIDDFEKTKKSEMDKFISRWAFRIENTKPAECEDLLKYKDYAGNEKKWKDILRTVGNAVAGTRNYPNLSKKEVDKY